MAKNNILIPVVNQTCPRCHQGKVFKHNFSYSFKKITEMHSHCSHCNLKYEKEPGFFYGAMYVSYGLTVALWISVAVAFYVLTGSIQPWLFMAVGILLLFALLPGIYRLSRMIWLIMFVAYDPEFEQKKEI